MNRTLETDLFLSGVEQMNDPDVRHLLECLGDSGKQALGQGELLTSQIKVSPERIPRLFAAVLKVMTVRWAQSRKLLLMDGIDTVNGVEYDDHRTVHDYIRQQEARGLSQVGVFFRHFRGQQKLAKDLNLLTEAIQPQLDDLPEALVGFLATMGVFLRAGHYIKIDGKPVVNDIFWAHRDERVWGAPA